MTIADQFIKSGMYRYVLVIGAETMSRILDWTDRNTCILFGDAAAAVLLQPNTDGFGIQDSILRSDGSGRDYLHMKAGGSLKPASVETVLAKEHFAFQEGKTVFKFAVKGMADVSAELLEKNNLTGDDIAWLVPHQANLRIIDATADRMGISKDKVMINIERYGNTTAATIPLCLYEWQDQLKKGDNLVLAAFGGGFTWGATLVKWGF
jgi:3-oxoacyl-[acyl-carrier-protein] synthase-3